MFAIVPLGISLPFFGMLPTQVATAVHEEDCVMFSCAVPVSKACAGVNQTAGTQDVCNCALRHVPSFFRMLPTQVATAVHEEGGGADANSCTDEGVVGRATATPGEGLGAGDAGIYTHHEEMEAGEATSVEEATSKVRCGNEGAIEGGEERVDKTCDYVCTTPSTPMLASLSPPPLGTQPFFLSPSQL